MKKRVMRVLLLLIVFTFIGQAKVWAQPNANEALFSAILSGRYSGVEKALDAGANLLARDDHERTPLQLAIESGKMATASLLLSVPGLVDEMLITSDINKQIPLRRAIKRGNTDTGQMNAEEETLLQG